MQALRDVYFDTNAFSDLFRHVDEPLEARRRRRIRDAVRSKRIRLLTAGWTIEELGGLAESRWDVYHEITEFVFANADGLFEETGTLVERELQLGRPLTRRELFIPGAQERLLRAATRRQRRLVIDSYKEHQDRATASRGKQLENRVHALAKISAQEISDGLTAGEGMTLWCSDLARFIKKWTAEYTLREARALGLDVTGDAPRSQTLESFVAYSLARVCWYLRDSRRIDRGDDADVHHYTCSCYGDVLVSGDDRMAGVVALIPKPSHAPLSLDELVEQFT
jgi:hypothetical protein